MKKYNRITKKYEEVTTEKVSSLKKRELCRGGNPHQVELVMPSYLFNGYELTQEQIEQYYLSKERVLAFEKKEVEILTSLGIPEKLRWGYEVYRHKRCKVCGKKEW